MSTKRKAEGHSRAVNKPRTMKPRGSRTDSERDSGFSDASSEHMSTMDSEGPTRHAVPKGVQTSGSQLAVVGGSYSNLSPMIIMNNVLLKQPKNSPPALKTWGFNQAVEVVQPVVQQPQVVFLQPVVSRQASHKKATSRHKRPKKFLPILKSYPKIAPHPGDSSTSSGRGTASSFSSASSSSSYSSSSGSKRSRNVSSNRREHRQREKQPKSLCEAASSSGSTATSLPDATSTTSPLLQNRLSVLTTEASDSSTPTSERPSSVISQSELSNSLSYIQTPGSKSQTRPFSRTGSHENLSQEESDTSDGDVGTRRKRFRNTYNILSTTGLLDITLRTKELLRQNRHAQNDLDRLKEHTNLFLQAVWSGDSSICHKLQASLQEEDRAKEREKAAKTSSKADQTEGSAGQ